MENQQPITSGRWPAPAKINLFLHVVGRRDDGYHLLQTLFQFLDYGDEIHFRLRSDNLIRRVGELKGVAAEDDLVVRAARLLQSRTGVSMGVDISVNKLLPMGGGLGGGSSNAATVLVALNELWKSGLTTSELAALGLELGADVPVFVHGYAAWAEGVGESLTPYDTAESPVLVIDPGCQVPTGAVFADAELTRDTPSITMLDFSLPQCGNDCEAVTRRLFPEVAGALDWMAQFVPARMSGTGACIFGLFESFARANQAAREVPAPWNWFVALRRNRSPLLERLALERQTG